MNSSGSGKVPIQDSSKERNENFYNIMKCSQLKVNRCFGGTCRLHFRRRKESQAGNWRESRWHAELQILPGNETTGTTTGGEFLK
jgi:hypothetical protein